MSRITVSSIFILITALYACPAAHAQDTIRSQWSPYVTYIHEFPNANIEFTFGEYWIHYKEDSTWMVAPDIFNEPANDSVCHQIHDPEEPINCNSVSKYSTISTHPWWGGSLTIGPGDTLTYFCDRYSYPHRGAVYQGFDIADTIIYVMEVLNLETGSTFVLDTIGTAPFYWDDFETYTDLPDLRKRATILPNDTAIIRSHVFTSIEFPERAPVEIRWRLVCDQSSVATMYLWLREAGGVQSEFKIEDRANMINRFRQRIERLHSAQTKPRKL